MQSNPCVRCGRQRVDGKVWTEMVGHVLVTYAQTICPDSTCQKIVEEETTARREKRELLASKRVKSNQARGRLSTVKKVV